MQQKIKCIVWDLDNTLWKGNLLEGDKLVFLDEMRDILSILDQRGIVHSIASKNEYSYAKIQLEEYGIWEYFLYPQINWDSKDASIEKIAQYLNIGLESIAFIDDSLYELENVKFHLPSVLCIHTNHMSNILDMSCMNPKFVTDEARARRNMYKAEIQRKESEHTFLGNSDEFHKTLNMALNIKCASENDLMRVEELTIRTHQLNTTGYTYSYEELHSFIEQDGYKLIIAELKDKFGSYGKIGIVLLQQKDYEWCIKLFLMSCRVITRGVGKALLNYIINAARDNNVDLVAEFKPNDKNRLMYAMYKFAGFNETDEHDGLSLMKCNYLANYDLPNYMEICVSDDIFG